LVGGVGVIESANNVIHIAIYSTNNLVQEKILSLNLSLVDNFYLNIYVIDKLIDIPNTTELIIFDMPNVLQDSQLYELGILIGKATPIIFIQEKNNTNFLPLSYQYTTYELNDLDSLVNSLKKILLSDINIKTKIYKNNFNFQITESNLKKEQENLKKLQFELEKKEQLSIKEKNKLLAAKELIKRLENDLEDKNIETENIKEIITFLASMPKEISEEQKYLKNRRKRFTQFGGLFLSLGVLTAIALISNVLWDNKLGLPSITNTSQYFAYALAIGFPMAMAFLFYRQANVKSKEIEKINEKSILVQQVENALNSYNVLLSGDELKDKTISSIDRVINKIFDNNHKEEKSEKIEENKLTISDVQKLFKMGSDVTKS